MKNLWCWRCKMEIPMLDEAEFEVARQLYSGGFHEKATKRQLRFNKLLKYYTDLTGFTETEPNAVLHHRISLYGPPCENCGKPYRTPEAKFCAACGNRRKEQTL